MAQTNGIGNSDLTDDEVFSFFVSEALRLNSLPRLNGVELDYSARHLASQLRIKGVKLFVTAHIQVQRHDNKYILGSYTPRKEFGFKNAIKIDSARLEKKDEESKLGVISTFVHEMYHLWQHHNLQMLQRAIVRGDVENETYKFEGKVMAEVKRSVA